jgi:hypothetical protein
MTAGIKPGTAAIVPTKTSDLQRKFRHRVRELLSQKAVLRVMDFGPDRPVPMMRRAVPIWTRYATASSLRLIDRRTGRAQAPPTLVSANPTIFLESPDRICVFLHF